MWLFQSEPYNFFVINMCLFHRFYCLYTYVCACDNFNIDTKNYITVTRQLTARRKAKKWSQWKTDKRNKDRLHYEKNRQKVIPTMTLYIFGWHYAKNVKFLSWDHDVLLILLNLRMSKRVLSFVVTKIVITSYSWFSKPTFWTTSALDYVHWNLLHLK